MIQMTMLPAIVKRGITPEEQKWSCPKSYLIFLLRVPDLVYKSKDLLKGNISII